MAKKFLAFNLFCCLVVPSNFCDCLLLFVCLSVSFLYGFCLCPARLSTRMTWPSASNVLSCIVARVLVCVLLLAWYGFYATFAVLIPFGNGFSPLCARAFRVVVIFLAFAYFSGALM